MRKLHLDTDLGGDIDDLCALAMVLNWPAVELVGVTTVSDDGGRRAGHVRYALEIAGRSDIPVCAGADISEGYYDRWQPGFPDEDAYWPEPIQPAHGPAIDAIALLEHSVEQGATIAAIGPFTNLALLEQRSPGLLRRARLVLIGGYVFPPREGFPQWGADMDYNVQVDVKSAEYVLQHSTPTLARQAEAFARDEDMEAQFGRTCAGLPDDIINFLHDPLACAIALGWTDGGVEIRGMWLKSEIKDGRLYQTVDQTAKPASVVTRVNGSEFSEFWLRTVTQN